MVATVEMTSGIKKTFGSAPQVPAWFVREQALSTFVLLPRVKMLCVDGGDDGGGSLWHYDGLYCISHRKITGLAYAQLSMSGPNGRCARLSHDGVWDGAVRVFSVSAWTAFALMVRHHQSSAESRSEEFGSRLRTIFRSCRWWDDLMSTDDYQWMRDRPLIPNWNRVGWLDGAVSLDHFLTRQPESVLRVVRPSLEVGRIDVPRRDSSDQFS